MADPTTLRPDRSVNGRRQASLKGCSVRRAVHIALLAGFVGAAAANSNFEHAFDKAEVDSVNPALRGWYLLTLRPAFRSSFHTILGECAPIDPEALRDFGLVFTLSTTGRVKTVFWKNVDAVTDCMDVRLRSTEFPPAPQDDFHFGLRGSLLGR